MPLIDLDTLEGGGSPELLFGLVAPVGAPLGSVESTLEHLLESRGYVVELVHVSKFLSEGLDLESPLPPAGADEYTRISYLMTRGDELRRLSGGSEALALLTAAHINDQRPVAEPRHLPKRAFIIRQLKHPQEVEWLRRIYGPAFHLVGVYSPRVEREKHLVVVRKMTPDQARELFNRDEEEPAKWGQQLRSTFHLADVFIEQWNDGDVARSEEQLKRFLDLLFGEGILTPTKVEYGMYLARAAALRSADLSRQVGAAILSERGEVLAVGVNEVPCFGGGQYWGGAGDQRDYVRGHDSNDQMKRETLREIVADLIPGWKELGPDGQRTKLQELAKQFDGARIMNLIEFGRAVHAEMEAITAAARIGVSITGSTLFTTTFPCHNCAKHIVAAGITRVVYVEPYPKSLALELHDDSIAVEIVEEGPQTKVRFEPFVGVAPRRYGQLFSTVTEEGRRLMRKDDEGNLLTTLGVRLRGPALSYVQRESVAAIAAEAMAPTKKKES